LMKISIQSRPPTDSYLRWASQIGVDCLDAVSLPGVKQVGAAGEQGCADLEKLLKLRRWIRSFGLDMNRVSLPNVSKFMLGHPGGDEQVENACKTLKVLGEARIPIARPTFATSSGVWPETHGVPRVWPKTIPMRSVHRGGYLMRGFDLAAMRTHMAETEADRTEVLPEEWWSRVEEYYGRLISLAEECGVKIAMHPSDPPMPDTPFSGLGYHHVLDIRPSPNSGLLYCVGTRCEAGGTRLVLDEINHFGRKGKIFLVHFRNVRGSLASTGAFEEVLLDDGDMNMFEILLALQKIGYEGCLNPDHTPILEGDTPERRMAWSYSVGYLKALLAALAALP
jgi:mannonate dehydratase